MIIQIRSSILGKQPTSDVFFASWCILVSSECHFKMSLRSAALSIGQSVWGSLELGTNWRVSFPSVSLCMDYVRVLDKKSFRQNEDSPLNYVFSSTHNFPVAGHGASDLHPKITERSFRNKLRMFFNYSFKFYINITAKNYPGNES